MLIGSIELEGFDKILSF